MKHVWKCFLYDGYLVIAQELPTQEHRVKWGAAYCMQRVANLKNKNLYPFLMLALATSKTKYTYIEFEINKSDLEDHDGIDDRNGDLIVVENFENDTDLKEFLEKRNIGIELFLPPWRCDYPL